MRTYTAVSADGHVNEPPNLWIDRLPAKLKDRGPHVIETPNTHGHAWIVEGQERPNPLGLQAVNYRNQEKFDRSNVIEKYKTVLVRGLRYEDILPGSYDPVARLKEMEEDQIDAEVLFNGAGGVWPGIKDLQDRELALACVKVYNDWIAEYESVDRERFVATGTVPLTGVEDSTEEMERCVDKLGLRSVTLECYPSGSFIEPAPEDDCFWARAQEIGIPVNLHSRIITPPDSFRITNLSRPGFSARLGVPLETGSFRTVLGKMILAGVFERFPDLKFVGTEVQVGWIPFFLEQFDETFRRYRSTLGGKLSMLPSEYFHRNVWAVYTLDEMGADNRYFVGVDKMMWGPDFPHSASNWPVDYELGLESLTRAGATKGEIERIMWKNAADLYGLEYAE